MKKYELTQYELVKVRVDHKPLLDPTSFDWLSKFYLQKFVLEIEKKIYELENYYFFLNFTIIRFFLSTDYILIAYNYLQNYIGLFFGV